MSWVQADPCAGQESIAVVNFAMMHDVKMNIVRPIET